MLKKEKRKNAWILLSTAASSEEDQLVKGKKNWRVQLPHQGCAEGCDEKLVFKVLYLSLLLWFSENKEFYDNKIFFLILRPCTIDLKHLVCIWKELQNILQKNKKSDSLHYCIFLLLDCVMQCKVVQSWWPNNASVIFLTEKQICKWGLI